jgi:hypothetical protein
MIGQIILKSYNLFRVVDGFKYYISVLLFSKGHWCKCLCWVLLLLRYLLCYKKKVVLKRLLREPQPHEMSSFWAIMNYFSFLNKSLNPVFFLLIFSQKSVNYWKKRRKENGYWNSISLSEYWFTINSSKMWFSLCLTDMQWKQT